MNTAALILAAAAATAPQPQPQGETIEAEFVQMRAGQTFECANPTGCVAMTPEFLRALLAEAIQRGAASCRRNPL